MEQDIWGVFHDGTLSHIEGSVPGSVTLRMEIPYLRDQFPETGDYFVITLSHCTLFRYTNFDGQATSDLQEIGNLQPECLYIKEGSHLQIDCAKGLLEIDYDDMTVTLPSGRNISYESLSEASDRYWDRHGD